MVETVNSVRAHIFLCLGFSWNITRDPGGATGVRLKSKWPLRRPLLLNCQLGNTETINLYVLSFIIAAILYTMSLILAQTETVMQ
jgi:hypothetical protein